MNISHLSKAKVLAALCDKLNELYEYFLRAHEEALSMQQDELATHFLKNAEDIKPILLKAGYTE